MTPSLPPARERVSVWRLLVPVAFVAAGLLFATSAQLTDQGELRPEPQDTLDLIRQREVLVEQRLRTVRGLRDEIAALEANQRPGDVDQAKVELEVRVMSPVVGMQSVEGPGVEVTLADSNLTLGNAPEGVTADDLVVHQSDIQAVINALWAGGAEAVMVMDQRVISTSAVRCVGNTLLLHGQVYGPPFTVTAIGDAQVMQAALDADPQVQLYRDVAQQLGLRYDVRVVDLIRVPEYSGRVALGQARVVE